jgi:hypothetical protein
MNHINTRLIIVAIALFIIAILAYASWNALKDYICFILQSGAVTAIIWIFLFVLSAIHYFGNNITEKNSINDKAGLEKPFEYLQFVGTYGTILTSAQTLGREFFMQWNFPEITSCKNFSDLDKISLLCCVFVLVHYSYIKIYPVVIEAFVKKIPIEKDGFKY